MLGGNRLGEWEESFYSPWHLQFPTVCNKVHPGKLVGSLIIESPCFFVFYRSLPR